MRDRIAFGVGERVHVVAQQVGVDAAFDARRVTAFDGQRDRLAHVVLLRQQDVAAVDHDRAARGAIVRIGQREAARPVIPAARRVDEAVFGGRRELAERAHERGAGRRAHAHLARGGDFLRCGEHARAVGQGRHHPHQHFGRLDREQDLRARFQDVVLLGREQQRHQVEHEVALAQRGDRGAVAGQRRRAEVGERVAAECLVAVDGRQVEPVDDRAERLRRDQRARQRLRMGGRARQDRDGLARLEARQREDLLPRVDQLGIADWHRRLR